MKTSFAVRFALAAALALATPACISYHPLTPAQLAQLGTRRYVGVNKDKATDACATALVTLGYDVTVKENDTGLIKTAPKMMSVSASSYSVTEDGLAWTISVEQVGSDTVLHATPRGFRNGSEMHGNDMWVAEAIDSKFQDLWQELDGNLHAKAAAPPVKAM